MEQMKYIPFDSSSPLSKPRVGGSVWPEQCCPAFTPRPVALGAKPECWFCIHADFHIWERVALDVGICYWPKEVS